MKKVCYILLVCTLIQSCKEDSVNTERTTIDDLEGVVLEITDREDIGSREESSHMFGAYIHAIKLYPDGTCQLLDDYLGSQDWWSPAIDSFRWSSATDKVIFEIPINNEPATIVWEVVSINDNQLVVRESSSLNATESQYALRISDKQEIRTRE